MTPPEALLLLSRGCPHCAVMLANLAEMVKRGDIGRLQVVNIEAQPDFAEAEGVRSVPWLRLGPFELTGLYSAAELEIWLRRAAEPEGMADAFHDLLKTGGLRQVLSLVAAMPGRLAALLPIVGNPEASINVRIGAGVVFEASTGTAGLRALIPALGDLSNHADARVRADACHYLALAGGDAARDWLQARLSDADADVREIAQEGLLGL